MDPFFHANCLSSSFSRSSHPSSPLLQHTENGQAQEANFVAETEGDRFCGGLKKEGVVGDDFEVLQNHPLSFPDIQSVVIPSVKHLLEQQCIIESVPKPVLQVAEQLPTDELKKVWGTKAFKLMELLAHLDSYIKIPNGGVEDIQIIGSAVPWLLGSYPTQIEHIKKYWNPTIQSHFAKAPNDFDIRIYLNNGTTESLEQAEDLILRFLGLRIDECQLDPLERKKLVIEHLLTKREIVEGDNEYLAIGFAPKGLPPIDILIVNRLSRENLWTQDSLRLSIRGIVLSSKKIQIHHGPRTVQTQSCTLVSRSSYSTTQAIVDRAAKIIRLESYDGLDFFSVLPLLLSAYIKGYRIAESSSKLEETLLSNFLEVCKNTEKSTYVFKGWVNKVLLSSEIGESKNKYVHVLAEGLRRAVKSHHSDSPEALIAIGIAACQLLVKFGYEEQAQILWKEIAASKKLSGIEINGFYGNLKALLTTHPQLLCTMLAWVEIRAFLGLFKDSVEPQHPKSLIVRHKSGIAIQYVVGDIYQLLPIDPNGSVLRLNDAYRQLNAEQRAIFDKIYTENARISGVSNDRSLRHPFDISVFEQSLGTAQSIARIAIEVLFVQNLFLDFSWFEKSWEKVIVAYDDQEKRIELLSKLEQIYKRQEEQQFLSSIRNVLVSSGNRELKPVEYKLAILFAIHEDRKMQVDYQLWQETRSELEEDVRRKMGKGFCYQANAYRPDIASMILADELTDGLPHHEVEADFSAVVKATLKQKAEKRSWSRLKTLLSAFVKAKGSRGKMQSSTERDTMLIQLLDLSIQERAFDIELVESICTLVDPSHQTSDMFIKLMRSLLEQSEYTKALQLWNMGEKRKLWKPGELKSIALQLAQLSLECPFFPLHTSLYKQLQKLDSAEDYSRLIGKMDTFFSEIKEYNQEWTHAHSTSFMMLLRTPFIGFYLMRKQDHGLFEAFYSKVVNEPTLNSHRTTLLAGRDQVDLVDAILCIGFLRNKAQEQVKRRIAERQADITRTLYHYNCITEAGDILRAPISSRKVALNAKNDGEMLHRIIVRRRDFVLFVQYKNILDTSNHIANMEQDVVEWMAETSMGEWEKIYPKDLEIHEVDESTHKNLWPFICKLMLRKGIMDGELSTICQRALQKAETKKLSDVFGSIGTLCEVHAEGSLQGLLNTLKVLFSKGAKHKGASNEYCERIWSGRKAVEDLLKIPYGHTEEWKDIDTEIALMQAAQAACTHPQECLPLLLQTEPSQDITRVVCQVMSIPGAQVRAQMLGYMEAAEGKEVNIRLLLSHASFVDILTQETASAAEILKLYYQKSLKKEMKDLSLEILSIALQLVDKIPETKDDKFWRDAIVKVLTSTSATNARFHTIVKLNFDAICKILLTGDDKNAVWYALLQTVYQQAENTILPPQVAERACYGFCEVLPTLPDVKARTDFLCFIKKHLGNGNLIGASQAIIGSLLLQSVKLAIEKDMHQEVEPFVTLLTAANNNNGYFDDPRSVDCAAEIFKKFHKNSNGAINRFMESALDIPEIREIALVRMKALIDSSKGMELSCSEKKPLLLLHSHSLRHKFGEEYIHNHILAITLKGDEILPYLYEIFDLCFTFDYFPSTIWEKLFQAVNRCRNEDILEFVATHTMRYVSINHRSEDQYASAVVLLNLVSYYIPHHSSKKVLQLFKSPEFVDKLLTFKDENSRLVYSNIRLLIQFVPVAISENPNDAHLLMWNTFKLRAYQFIDTQLSVPAFAITDDEELKTYNEEKRMFNFFSECIEVSCLGTDDQFNLLIPRLVSVFESIEDPTNTKIVLDNGPFFLDCMPQKRRMIALDRVLSGMSRQLYKDKGDGLDPAVLGTLDGLVCRYNKEYGPAQLLQASLVWAQEGTPAFATQLTIAMQELDEALSLEKHLAGYIVFLHEISKRTDCVSLGIFLKATAKLHKRDPQSAKLLTLEFYRHYIIDLYTYAHKNNFSAETHPHIQEFINVLHLSLRAYFSSAIKLEKQVWRRGDVAISRDVYSFDEECSDILEKLYIWVSTLRQQGLKELSNQAQNDLLNAMKRLTSTPTEQLLLQCYQRLNWANTLCLTPQYSELYHDLIQSLETNLRSVKTQREADIYAQIFEEFCQIDVGNDSSICMREAKSKLLMKVFEHPKVHDSINHQLPSLFKYAHIVKFSSRDTYDRFSERDVMLGCEQVICRLEKAKATRSAFVLDILIPDGIKLTEINHVLMKKKFESFVKNPERYLNFWDVAFAHTPMDLHSELKHVIFDSIHKLALQPEIVGQCPLEQLTAWHSIVRGIAAKWSAHLKQRKENKNEDLTLELSLYQNLLIRRYYNESHGDCLNAIFDIGMRWIEHSNLDESSNAFKLSFANTLAILAGYSWPQDSAQARDKMFFEFIRSLLHKKPSFGNDYANNLLNYWQPIVGSHSSVCLERLSEEAHTNFDKEFNELSSADAITADSI